MTIIRQYTNGGYRVTLYSDGTKTREIIPPQFPESIDIKITNRCDLSSYCKWCHEQSHKAGEHADIKTLINVLSQLQPGAELAIGGGNPLAHPQLKHFLTMCKTLGLVCNITINQFHVNKNMLVITDLVQNELVHGIGITYSGKSDIQWLHEITENVVYHVIAGVHSPTDIEHLPKSLVLGYKTKGNGIDFYTQAVRDSILNWKIKLPYLLGKNIVSFDNLALEQLDVKRLLTPEKWEECYMGDDGTFTFYIDAVNQEYAKSSTSVDRFDLIDMESMFKHVRSMP